jgi:hypothetical protein
MNVLQIISSAREQLSALTGLSVDTVSRFDRNGDGWVVEIDMIELRRIPNSSDVLATYQINLDSNGDIVSYLRTQRYYRSEVRA